MSDQIVENIKTGVGTDVGQGIETPIAYAVGLVYASVCSPWGVEQTTEWLNDEYPTGLGHGWVLAEEPFSTGEPNPCPCNQSPHRKHYLFNC